MPSKIYSLRPPALAKDGLETMFRIEMKKDDLAAEGLKPGDVVAVTAQTSGKGGVGVVYLSSETAKSQGNASYVKMHPRLRVFMNLDLSDKCTISKYHGPQPAVKTVVLSENGASLPGDLLDWAQISLRQLPGILAEATFTVTPSSGFSPIKKHIISVEAIEGTENGDNAQLAVPSRFEAGYSRIKVDLPTPAALESSTVDASASAVDRTLPVVSSFAGLPGLEEQLCELSKCIQRVNRKVEQRYEQLAGCVPILLHGPTGTGKTAVLEQLSNASGWKQTLRLSASELSSTTSKNRITIVSTFAQAAKIQPSLLMIDDLHSIAGRSADFEPQSRDLVEQITSLRGTKVQIVATARRPIDVEQKLVSCFMKKIEFASPTSDSREKILRHITKGLAQDLVLRFVAEKTHAFTATDLEALCFVAFEAAETRIAETETARIYDDTENSSFPIGEDEYQQPGSITAEDFQYALRQIHPSLMDELYIEVPRVYWKEIAGSEHVKSKLWEAVELPLKHPDIVARLNLHPSHGILLYGPPGCSKTMTAKALATESGLNFIAVKGPELVSKYVGESEYKIREIFRKARTASPSVIFFDEIDSIAPNREGGGGHEGLNTVATLLNEMDGVEDVARVLVLAATNRPEAIDPALLRPGRLGTTLYVGPPDRTAILQILQSRVQRMSSKPEDLDLAVVAGQMADNGQFSGADVAAFCDAAGMLCATEAVAALGRGETVELQQKHLEQALESTKPTLNKQLLESLKTWTVGRNP